MLYKVLAYYIIISIIKIYVIRIVKKVFFFNAERGLLHLQKTPFKGTMLGVTHEYLILITIFMSKTFSLFKQLNKNIKGVIKKI